ncbi:MAG: heavy metal translocating P-type ATPase [Geminicoccales bacterium]
MSDIATDAIAADAFVRDLGNGLASLSCSIDGMHCGACATKIERGLERVNGVALAQANATTKRLRIVWDPGLAKTADLIETVRGLGFTAHAYAEPGEKSRNDQSETNLLIPLAVAGFGMMNIMGLSFASWAGLVSDMSAGTQALMHGLSAAIAVPVAVYAGAVFYSPAWTALRHGRMTMDLPITLAIITTMIASLHGTFTGSDHVYFDAAISLIFFLLIGRVLDQMLRRRSDAASSALRELSGGAARRLGMDGALECVLVDALKPGDTLLMSPGERIPVDGRLLSDQVEVEESLISGETLPKLKKKGDHVIGGSIVIGQAVRIDVTATSETSRLSTIADLMEAAENHRGRGQRLADRFARGYGPLVIGAALLGFLFWWLILDAAPTEAMMIAVAVLVVTCPCAAGLATPAVVTRAINRLMAEGVIVKSGDALERLAEIDAVLIDKTGTLTDASLQLDRDTDWGALQAAAAIGANSAHPLARALVDACPGAVMTGVREVRGEGLEARDGARLGSASFVGLGSQEPADGPVLWYRAAEAEPIALSFSDRPRPDAEALVSGLEQQGLSVSLISGDHRRAVADLAARIGIRDWHASMQPETKLRHVQRQSAAGERLLMIGDGLNDAPSLAAAHVSMSPSSAIAVTQTAADIILTGDRLTPAITAIDTARRAKKLIRENLIVATLYNVVTLPIALAGGLTPLIAAILMSSSSLLVMLNAMRIGRQT